MNRITAVCFNELKRTLKNPATYVLMLAMPLLFSFLFGSLFGGGDGEQKVKIALTDQDRTEMSKQLIRQLDKEEEVGIKEVSREKAREALDGGNADAVITIPKGFAANLETGKKPEIELSHQPSSTVAPILQQLANQAVSSLQMQVVSAKAWSEKSGEAWETMFDELKAGNSSAPAVRVVSEKGEQKAVLTGVSQSSPGFSIMFVMFMIISMAGTLIEARQNGVWQRLFMTPATRFQVMFGYFLAFFLIGWIQFGLLMLSSSLLFGVGWGNPLATAVLVSALLLCVVGLGLAIASLVKTPEQQGAVSSLVIVSTCMLGGVYWPLSIVPDFMQKIAQFVPQTWAMKGFTTLMADGGSLGDIYLPVLILLGFAAVFLTVGIARTRSAAA